MFGKIVEDKQKDPRISWFQSRYGFVDCCDLTRFDRNTTANATESFGRRTLP
ncbi:MAG: hypothetical protein A07HR60_02873 [uncultured archaeon A07HR60]|nr:MAG: hypothetical protein A07HR60_02873 [uncultured archaeon A07HR60]